MAHQDDTSTSWIGGGLLGVLGLWLAAALVLRPFQNAPVVDDWVYAWSVEHLLATRRFEVLDLSANLILAQTLWGAIFCAPFGFSFAALRLSTWVLSCASIIGVYRLLVDAGATRKAATLGAAALAAYPPFLVLSFSFMTDVPLLAAETWTLVCFARAIRRESNAALWAGVALAAAAGTIRYVGLVPALAMSATLLCHSGRWGRARCRFLVPLVSVAAVAALVLQPHYVRHVADLTYIEDSPGWRLAALREYALALLPTWLPYSAEFAAVGLGLTIIPVACALPWRSGSRTRLAAVVVASVAVVAIGQWLGAPHFETFTSEGLWDPDHLGGTLTLLGGWTWRTTPMAVILVATLCCWSAFVVSGWTTMRRAGEDRARPLFWWTAGGLVLMTALLWLVGDRYIFPFVPPAFALVLGRNTRVAVRRAILPLLMFAAIGIVAVRDETRVQHALWEAVNDLQRQGVPAAEIDAGYMVNGWLQYAHPERGHHDADGEVSVPWVNGDPSLPWIVGVGPRPDAEVVRQYPFELTGRSPAAVLVMKRKAAVVETPR